MSKNNIGDSGVHNLSMGLRINNVLTVLDLSENNIGDSGASSISDSLIFNTVLITLNISKNNIGDNGASSLCQALNVNTTLTNLDVSGNNISDFVLSTLSEALRVNATKRQTGKLRFFLPIAESWNAKARVLLIIITTTFQSSGSRMVSFGREMKLLAIQIGFLLGLQFTFSDEHHPLRLKIGISRSSWRTHKQ